MKLVDYVKSHASLQTSPEIEHQKSIIIEVLRKDPNHSTTSLADITGMPYHIVRERVDRLAKEGKIQYVSMWIVTEELNK